MKRRCLSALCVSMLSGSVAAQTTKLDIQLSLDGVSWSDNIEFGLLPPEHRTVLVRYLVSWQPGGGVSNPVGFASLTFQPVIEGALDGDSVLPFVAQGNNRNGGGIDLDANQFDGPFGRIKPFAATGPSGARSYVAHRHTNGAGGAPVGSNYLRIARNDITRWVGQGPTTGSAAANNFNGAGGVACVQRSSGNVAPTDPPFQSGTTEINILQIAVSIVGIPADTVRGILLSAPPEGMSRNASSGAREASWFRDGADNSGAIKGAVLVDGAFIFETPTPGSALLMGVWSASLIRRRQRG
ncbi:MAG: hypothetical protein JSR77_06680 [Planctomycetes bacterium]|nr:hypothetical protein [Planctomycetota bacterium]